MYAFQLYISKTFSQELCESINVKLLKFLKGKENVYENNFSPTIYETGEVILKYIKCISNKLIIKIKFQNSIVALQPLKLGEPINWKYIRYISIKDQIITLVFC